MRWPFRASRADSRAVGDLTVAMLREFVPQCYACGKDISGHEYAEFASCVVHNKQDPQAHWFFKLFLEERWVDLRQERSFEGTNNAAVVYAVLCGAGGQMLAIRSPYELWENNSLLQIQEVKLEAASKIRELGDNWKRIPDKDTAAPRGN
jgi:hypothetical protein